MAVAKNLKSGLTRTTPASGQNRTYEPMTSRFQVKHPNYPQSYCLQIGNSIIRRSRNFGNMFLNLWSHIIILIKPEVFTK